MSKQVDKWLEKGRKNCAKGDHWFIMSFPEYQMCPICGSKRKYDDEKVPLLEYNAYIVVFPMIEKAAGDIALSAKVEQWKIVNRFDSETPVCLVVKHITLPLKAYIKWDGCVEVTGFEEGDRDTESYTVHMCDVDDYIAMLKSLEEFRMANIEGAQ